MPIYFSRVSTGGLRGVKKERKHIWCTMFIHWISYLCSTRGNIYADDWWLYLAALLQPPPGNTECRVNKGPQQQNQETDKIVTNWHSHVINTQWYLSSGRTSSHTLIMINIYSDISNSLVLQLQPSVSTQIPCGRSHHIFIPSDLTGTTTTGRQFNSADSFIRF